MLRTDKARICLAICEDGVTLTEEEEDEDDDEKSEGGIKDEGNVSTPGLPGLPNVRLSSWMHDLLTLKMRQIHPQSSVVQNVHFLVFMFIFITVFYLHILMPICAAQRATHQIDKKLI